MTTIGPAERALLHSPPVEAGIGRCAAAQGGVVSRGQLLALGVSSSAQVEVTVQGGGRPGDRAVQIHRVRSLSADDVTEHAGLRVTTPARTLLDLADVLDPAALDQAIERALILRRFNANEVRAVLARANGRRGAKRLREAVGGVLDASPKARSIPGAILIVELDGRTTHTTPHARARRLHRRPRDRAPTRR